MKLSIPTVLKAAGAAELIAAGIGKSLAAMAHLSDGSNLAGVCLGLGVYLAGTMWTEFTGMISPKP